MSDSITPIQRDALGATTFEKVQTLEISEPDKSGQAPKTSTPACAEPSDGVNLSRPMKKFLVQKKSYFTAPPPPTEKQKDQKKREAQEPQTPTGEAYQKYSMTASQAGNMLSILG